MRKSIFKKVQVGASVALLLAVPALSNAATSAGAQSDAPLRVSYADLNLNSDEGVAVLYRRLQSASRTSCNYGTHMKAAPVRVVQSAKACYAETLSEAISELNNSKLSRVHSS